MNLCTSGHEEVCYDGRHCPACEVAAEKDDDIANLTTEIAELKSHIAELEESQANHESK